MGRANIPNQSKDVYVSPCVRISSNIQFQYYVLILKITGELLTIFSKIKDLLRIDRTLY